MNNVFFAGDTHFGHTPILEFEKAKRPFASIQEHDEAIVEHWNSVVKPKDTVYHLGDVMFGKHNEEILSRLNGVKKLIMGNHDEYGAEFYLKYFRTVLGAMKYETKIDDVKVKILLTHVPIHPSQFYRFTANVHGHLHSGIIADDPRYICVSIEQNNLKPISIEDIKLHIKETGVLPQKIAN